MQAKLTLSIDKNVIGRAKSYAQYHQQSVSGLVEAYLDRISTQQPNTQIVRHTIAPITDSLVGMFAQEGDSLEDKDYKTLLAEARMEKHL